MVLNANLSALQLTLTLIGQVARTLAAPLPVTSSTLAIPWSHGAPRKNQLLLGQALNQNTEYRSLAHACAETTWLGYLLSELGVNIQFPIVLYCDNLSATHMASNPVFHARTKHIELDYHFVRERVALGSHQVHFIPSVDQPADVLTKALHRPRHHPLCGKLVRPAPPSLKGGLRESAQT